LTRGPPQRSPRRAPPPTPRLLTVVRRESRSKTACRGSAGTADRWR
jgi:hypothetical protein